MKNLMIFVNPKKRFGGENQILIKIQIDNSLSLGWNTEDILLVTNFPYEYREVKSILVDDSYYFSPDIKSTKMNTLPEIFNMGLIKSGELYWCHDLDAYQTLQITEEELGLEKLDLGITGPIWSRRWSGGSFFFKDTSRDIFNKIKELMDRDKIDEETAMMNLIEDGTIGKDRYVRLDSCYNFTFLNVYNTYIHSKKPLKVVHFHPLSQRHHRFLNKIDSPAIFLRGENEMGVMLMPERLIKIFNDNGIK